MIITVDSNKSLTANFIPIFDKDDILGIWSSGVWYRGSDTGFWVKMMTPAQMITAGDLDGDDTDDLIVVWSIGLWMKNSSQHRAGLLESWLQPGETMDFPEKHMNKDHPLFKGGIS